MPNWKFWEKQTSCSTVTEERPTEGSRFGLPPRTVLPGLGKPIGPEKAEQLARLNRRRQTVLFDVEQAELAVAPENPWLDRTSLLDEALAAVRVEIASTSDQVEPPGDPFPPISIEELVAADGPPPAVSFRVGGEEFRYEEDQDWAERGFQLARGELQVVRGNPANIIADEAGADQFEARLEQLTSGLFVFASDVRDRALENLPLPEHVTVADLAKPDLDHGGWLDWKGHSSASARKEARLYELHAEERRLLDRRAQELEDLAKWEERLPIARRRLADVDAEIAAVGG